MAGDPASVFVGLGAEKHLDRERALRKFQTIIQDAQGTPLLHPTSCQASSSQLQHWHQQQYSSSAHADMTVVSNHAGSPQQLDQVADGVKQLLTDAAWEHKIGGLMAAKVRPHTHPPTAPLVPQSGSPSLA
jgi:hypothetical protein